MVRLPQPGNDEGTWGEILNEFLAVSLNGNGAIRDEAVANRATINRNINTADSIIGGGDLSSDRTIRLSGDAASPGNDKYYGTDSSGVKGYYALSIAGEANTASNIGVAGVGVFKQKTGTNLEFKKINAGSNKVLVTDDTPNNELDIDVDPAQFTGIPESAVTNLVTDLSNKVNTSEKAAVNGVATLDSGGKLVSAQIPDTLTIPPHESTGILSGGALSINADNTKFDIAAAIVFFIDDTNPAAPVRRVISFPGQTAIPVTNIGTHPATFVGFSQATPTTVNIVQSIAPFTNAERRNWAQLGAVIHTNLININTTNTITQTVVSGINQLWDLMQAIGPMNLNGNIFSAAAANLTLRRSSGVMFKAGSGFAVDSLAPHRVPLAASAVPITNLRYRTQLAETTGDITNVDPTKWDNGGVLTAVSGTNFTIQRVYLFQTGLARIQYGQATYTNMANALAALDTETFVTESNISENGLLRALLVVRGNCSDLTNTATAKIVEVAKLSGSAGSGGATLAIRDESVAVTSNVTQLNFIGSGVVAAAGSGEVTITIPGGAAGFVQLRKSGTQSIADITQTAITWDVEDSDTLAAHANAPNPSRVTVPEDGVYRFTAHVAVAGSVTGVSRLSLYINGVQQPGWAVCPNSTSPALVSFTREVSLTANQYVEIFVYQNSGGSMTVSNADPGQSVLTARKVGTV